MTSKMEDGVTTNFAYNAEHMHAPTQLYYDKNGNSSGTPNEIHWFDVENRLSGVNRWEPPALPYSTNYLYDGSREMVRRNVELAIYPAQVANDVFIDRIYQERSVGCGAASGYTKYYMALGRVIAQRTGTITGGVLGAGSLSFYAADHLGSTTARIDAVSGTMVESAQYWPFGSPRAGTSPDRAYTGQQKEGADTSALGLYYYHARFYSPLLGHFVSADPAGGGQNRYRYTYNSPMDSTDPTGLDAEPADANGLEQIAGAVLWWSTFFEVDPGIVLGLLLWEGDKSWVQELYETGAYFALSVGGEAGLQRYEADAAPILLALVSNALGPVAGLGGIAAGLVLSVLHGGNPVSWGAGNITLEVAQQLEVDNPVLAKSSMKGTIDALRTTGGGIAYLAAAVRSYAGNVPSVIGAGEITAHIIVQHNVGVGAYRDYLEYGAFPQVDASGHWAVTGRRDADGAVIGGDGAKYLNQVMPLVDLARSLIVSCTAGGPC